MARKDDAKSRTRRRLEHELAELASVGDRTLRGLSLMARVGSLVGEAPIIVGGFAVVFEAIKRLIAEDKKPRREIGFHAG